VCSHTCAFGTSQAYRRGAIDVGGEIHQRPRGEGVIHPNEELLRQAYAAQARGDTESYLDFLHDDFVLHIPGRSRLAGRYVGREAMRGHFAEIKLLSGGTFKTEPREIVASDEHGMAWIEASADRDGLTFQLPRVHAWRTLDGKLAELWLLPLDLDAFDGYWGHSTARPPSQQVTRSDSNPRMM
jgi:ketosteroid isomerase-like protein